MGINQILKFFYINLIIIFFTATFGISINKLYAATCTWTGASGDGLVSTSGNWSGCGGASPTINDSVIISTSTTEYIEWDSSAAGSVSSLSILDPYAGTTTLAKNLTITGNLNITGGTLNTSTSSTSYTLSVDGNVTISNPAGILVANDSTITVGGDWDSSLGIFRMGSSTVSLINDGNIKTKPGWPLYNLNASPSGATTTISFSSSDDYLEIYNTLTLNGGGFDSSYGSGIHQVRLYKTSGTSFVPNSSNFYDVVISYFNGTSTTSPACTGIRNIASGRYGRLSVAGDDCTFKLDGNITLESWGDITINKAEQNTDNTILQTGGYSITTNATSTVPSSNIFINYGKLDLTNNSTISIDNLVMGDFSATQFNARGGNINIYGNLTLNNDYGDATFGTSTVNFINSNLGNTTSTISGTGDLYNININKTGSTLNTVTLSSNNIRSLNDFTITDGIFDVNDKIFHISGDFSIGANGNIDATSSLSRIIFDGDTTYTDSSNKQNLGRLRIANATTTATLTLGSNATATNLYISSDDKLNIGQYTMYLENNGTLHLMDTFNVRNSGPCGNCRAREYGINSNGKIYAPTLNNFKVLDDYFNIETTLNGINPAQVGIYIDSNDNVYVITDSSSYQTLKKIDSNNNVVSTISLVHASEGLAIDSSGNIFTSSGNLTTSGTTTRDVVDKYTQEGTLLKTIGGGGSGSGQLTQPRFLDIDSSGKLYIPEGSVTIGSSNNRISVFDNNLNFITTFGSSGSSDGQLSIPYGVAIDSQDNFYVAEYGNNRISLFNPDHSFNKNWDGTESGLTQFSTPRGVNIGPFDTIYVSDYGNYLLVRYFSLTHPLAPLGTFIPSTGTIYFKSTSTPTTIASTTYSNITIDDRGNENTFYLNGGSTNDLNITNGNVILRKKFSVSNNLNNTGGYIKETSSAYIRNNSSLSLNKNILNDGDTLIVSVTDGDENISATTTDSIVVYITTSNDSETITLNETGQATGIFTGNIAVSAKSDPINNNNNLEFQNTNENITISYTDNEDSLDTSQHTILSGGINNTGGGIVGLINITTQQYPKKEKVEVPTTTLSTSINNKKDGLLDILLNKLTGPFTFFKKSEQTKILQEILSKDPDIYPEGLVTGYYGKLTKKAVERFQDKYEIAKKGDVAYGYAGPKTRKKIKEVFNKNNQVPTVESLLEQIRILTSLINELQEKLRELKNGI